MPPPSDLRVDPERTALTDGRSLTLKVARNVLRQLTEGGLLEWEGKSSGDPRQYYRIANVD